MDLTNLYSSLGLIKPEISASIFLVLIVVFDLIFHKDKKIIPYIAIIGLVVTSFFAIQQFTLSGFAFIQSTAAKSVGMVAVDSFGAFFKLLVLLVSILIVLFGYSSDEIIKIKDRIGEYYALIFGLILGMLVLISSANLILMYVALELMSLSSYVLAGFTKLRDRNSEASMKYLVYGAVSSGIMLFGISILFGLTGSTNLYVINSLIQGPQISAFALSVSVLFIFAGIGYKISSVPFHFWTPDVYEGAPITITAYLSVASKAAGFALLIRLVKIGFVNFVDNNGSWNLVSVFDWHTLLVVISILTMTLGNLSALWQDNLKRMLAYSSIAHAGYLLLGLIALSNQGLLAILVYFVFYAIMNLGAFYLVMLIANKVGSEEIDDYRGLGYTSPFIGVAFTIFLISLVGLPPTAGFIGKLYIFIGLIDAKQITVAVIAVLNSVISLYYYIRVLKHMFLTKATVTTPKVEINTSQIILITVLLIPTLLFGIYFTPIVNFAQSCINILGL